MDRSDCTTANDQADEAHVEDYLNTNPDARAGSASTSEKQCRICFSGPEEEDALGRLISPCMCAGSMRVSTELVLYSFRRIGRSQEILAIVCTRYDLFSLWLNYLLLNRVSSVVYQCMAWYGCQCGE